MGCCLLDVVNLRKKSALLHNSCYPEAISSWWPVEVGSMMLGVANLTTH